METFHQVWVIHNPVAGHKSLQRFERMLKLLTHRGVQPVVHDTGHPGHAGQLARNACAAGVDLILVAGGDGTLNEAINGVIQECVDREGFTVPPLAVFPSGTVNLVAQEIGVPADPEAFVEFLFSGSCCNIWPARVNDRYFMATAGIGFDSYVVSRVTRDLKKKISKWAYVLQTGLLMATDWDFSCRVRIDGREYAAASVIVMNGRYYAGRFTITPESALTKPLLYACLFEQSGKWDCFTYILHFLEGRLYQHKHVRIIAGNSIEITGAATLPMQVDGDISALLPACLCPGDISVRMVGCSRPAG